MPEAWLKSWVRVGDKVELPGLDLKVDKCGLMFVEPTRGPKGVYRWVDPTFPPAELSRQVCDFLHDARYKETPEQKAKAARVAAAAVTYGPRPFDPDQEKFFRDVAPDQGQHDRVRDCGNAAAAAGAAHGQILDVMRYHAGRFSVPLNDEKWLVRTAASIARRFGR